MAHMITNQQARWHLLQLYGLTGSSTGAVRRDQLVSSVEKLGYVQVDSVNVLERAHHHILFSRHTNYRRQDLHHLLEKDGALFENWTHDAAIIPSAFFPYWRHRFARENTRLRTRWKSLFGHATFDRELTGILDHITDKGPVMARDFEGNKPSTGWWDWHPSKAALEFLWRTGDLAIARREGFQKVYDLTERVVPHLHRAGKVDHDEFVDWACRQALARLGFATRGEIAAFWALLNPSEVAGWLSKNADELERVEVASYGSGKSRIVFSLPGTIDMAAKASPPRDRVRILSPFDPLLRDRARTERLFGFHYRIEIFVPEAKRQYGYYVYPVLRGDSAVGRIDVKAERNRDCLFVRAFWLDPGVRSTKTLVSKLEAELERLRRFAGVTRVEFNDGWLRA